MERREAIKRTAALMGGVIFAPTILGVVKGCTPSAERWTPVLFNNNQASLATALAGTIIPETDTPGAVEVGVPGFIEKMVNEVYTEEQRNGFLTGLDLFDEECNDSTGRSFAQLSAEEQYEYASEKNREAIEDERVGGPQFFLIFKELTMVGFFTSEVGATQVLRYEAVPGIYEGCVPFEQIGRTWAT
ncbi:MAG: gluconate 2-dehydrogenase subunit 3 family protein [Balneolaceae bacterium]|nr:MAG: gluconate 2-dehydrogenase subunit 3 family protein [Balneolaceae bacterium]